MSQNPDYPKTDFFSLVNFSGLNLKSERLNRTKFCTLKTKFLQISRLHCIYEAQPGKILLTFDEIT